MRRASVRKRRAGWRVVVYNVGRGPLRVVHFPTHADALRYAVLETE